MIEKTLGQVLDETAEKYPDNDALVYVDGPRYTYKEFKEIVDKVAKGLIKLGVKKGDHVAVWAYNVPEVYCILTTSCISREDSIS